MTNSATETKAAPQSKKLSVPATKTPLSLKLKASAWYSNASQSIAIGRGGDHRSGHHWLIDVDREQD